MPKSRKLMLGLLAAAAAMLIMAQPAVAADDHNNGSRTSKPRNVKCTSNGSGAIACFRSKGDRIYVKDDAKDGHSAIAVWSHYLGDGSYRKGWCRNKHGYGTWALCNKQLSEDSYFEWWAVEFDAETGKWQDWSRSESAIS